MPVILCLHGAGSSGSIFKFQTTKLRAELRDYEFVFVDAPIMSGPGAGMLPVFADAGPFHVWFGMSDSKLAQETEDIHQKIKKVVNAVQAGQMEGVKGRDIVGVMAFSQGVVVSTLLLLQQANGEVPWLPKLHFAIMICSDYTSEVMDYINSKPNQQDQVLVPSVHLHGDTDPYGPRSRMMLWTHYDQERCNVLTFQGAHQMPHTAPDCKRSARAISTLISDSWSPVQTLDTKEIVTLEKQDVVVQAKEMVQVEC